MNDIYSLIKVALWNETADGTITTETYNTIKQHALLPLMTNHLQKLDMDSDLRMAWKKAIYAHLVHYSVYQRIQNNLPLSVPYVILKGSAAGQYYPNPENRTYGDIDILVAHEDFEKASQEMHNAGFVLNKDLEREKGFIKDGIEIELHRYFSALNNPALADYLDNILINSINESHFLPTLLNGITLLEHINQHLENGLGLRQIIDWMMFVDKCLPDSEWSNFSKIADNIGLKYLAIEVTRMCEMYLGLSSHQFCVDANEKLCKQLMEYIVSCGNFGCVKNKKSIATNVFTNMRNPIAAYALLQERGLANWKAAKKHPFLKPFAWVYQACRYLQMVMGKRLRGKDIEEAFSAGKARRIMFDKLGVKQASKGMAVYKNGKFRKKLRH